MAVLKFVEVVGKNNVTVINGFYFLKNNRLRHPCNKARDTGRVGPV